jgi:hypothetical protein
MLRPRKNPAVVVTQRRGQFDILTQQRKKREDLRFLVVPQFEIILPGDRGVHEGFKQFISQCLHELPVKNSN